MYNINFISRWKSAPSCRDCKITGPWHCEGRLQGQGQEEEKGTFSLVEFSTILPMVYDVTDLIVMNFSVIAYTKLNNLLFSYTVSEWTRFKVMKSAFPSLN